MAKDREAQNEKPSFETVGTGLRVTDLLKTDVCPPLEETLNKIKICRPHFKDCVPLSICSPSPFCIPMWDCIPVDCGPIICYPDICTPRYFSAGTIFGISERLRTFRERSNLRTMAKELAPEIKEMTEELRKIRIEIEDLRKRIK